MISNPKKFIFIHIYKTAGSSVRSSLSPWVNQLSREKLLINTLLHKSFNRMMFKDEQLLWKHAGASEYREFLGSEYEKFFTFSFVRNPFDWQVSLYEYLRKSKGHHLHKFACQVSFKSYLKSCVAETIKTQSEFLTDYSGNLIVDKIGKYESLNDDFLSITKKLNLSTTLPHLNKTIRSKCNYYYDEESEDIILRNFKRDFELFNYPKKIPE